MSYTLRGTGAEPHDIGPRECISVDLRGLKAALMSRAKAQGASPSSVIRAALAASLDGELSPATSEVPAGTTAIKASLRLSPRHARQLAERARHSGRSRGAVIAALLDDEPKDPDGPPVQQMLAVLLESNARLADALRELRWRSHQSAVDRGERALVEAVARHLDAASAVVTSLRPRRVARKHPNQLRSPS